LFGEQSTADAFRPCGNGIRANTHGLHRKGREAIKISGRSCLFNGPSQGELCAPERKGKLLI
jgi:hypothetical protein